MALFKILKGNSNNLGDNNSNNSKLTHEGYAYFVMDTGKLYIDIDSNQSPIQSDASTPAVITGANRIALNAATADYAKQNISAITKGDTNGYLKYTKNQNNSQVEIYTHPSYTARASGFYKVTVDALGHISAVDNVAKSDITALLGLTPTANTGTVTKVEAGSGLKIGTDGTSFSTSGIINHSNSVTAVTAFSLLKVKYDTEGHITSSTAATASDITDALGYTPTTNTGTVTSITPGGGLVNGASSSTSQSAITTNGTISIGTGAVANTMLANSSISIAGQSVSLGGSLTATTLKSALSLGSAAYTDSTDYATSGHTHAWSEITSRPANAGSATRPVYWTSNAASQCNFEISTYANGNQQWGIRYYGTIGGSGSSYNSSTVDTALIMQDTGLFLYKWDSAGSNDTLWSFTKDSNGKIQGDITGSSGSCRGNAATATTLLHKRSDFTKGAIPSSAVYYLGNFSVDSTGTGASAPASARLGGIEGRVIASTGDNEMRLIVYKNASASTDTNTFAVGFKKDGTAYASVGSTLSAPSFNGPLTGNASTATGVQDAGDTSKTLTIRYAGSGVSATDWIPMYDSNGNLVPVSSTNLADKVRDKASGTWGINITGSSGAVTYQNSTLKISSTTFNISSQYERNLAWIGDSTGTGIGRINFIAKTDGTTQTSIQTRCWNTSGNAVGNFSGISIIGRRDNTVTYTVNSPANFRSAISAYSTSGGTLTGSPSIYPSATDSAWTSVGVYGGRSGTGTHKDSSNGVTYTAYEGKPWCAIYMQNRFKAVNSSSTTTWNPARIYFREYSAAANSGTRNGYHETYFLPSPNDGRTNNVNYYILTTKSAVTVEQGGTGATTFTSGAALIGAGTGAITTRSITNNTSATAVTASTNLITANTLYYHKGNSNIVTVGTITSGTWNGTAIAADYIGNHSTAKLTSGTLGVARGGTGTSTAPTQGGIIYASSTTAYASTAAGGAGQYLKSNGTSAPTWASMPAGTSISANTGKIYLTGYSSATKSAGLTYTLYTNTNVYISGTTGYLYAARVYNAVWNDIAEYRQTDNIEMGRVYQENNNGIMTKTQTRLIPGCSIASDTFGTAMGETTNAQTPMAIAGRVLVYTYQDRNNYQAGMVVCSAPNGTVDIMTREEIMMYPDAIIGTVSEIPEYEIWGHGNVKVDGRIWIKLK